MSPLETGKLYIGDYKNGKRHGWGRQILSSGEFYEGYFKLGEPTLEGIMGNALNLKQVKIFKFQFKDSLFLSVLFSNLKKIKLIRFEKCSFPSECKFIFDGKAADSKIKRL